MPDMLEIENIASDTPERTVVLSGISATVLFSVLNAGFKITDWWAGDLPLDQSQKDQVYAWLALANKELMVSQIGEVKMCAGTTIPAGCLLCDGGTYDRVDYPDLYATLAAAYIVDADHFIVPDLREKFVFGADADGDIGSVGGEATHTLIEPEIPSHAHTIPTTATTLAIEPGEVTVLTPIPIITSFTGSTGGSGAHNNIPPYESLRFYIVAV